MSCASCHTAFPQLTTFGRQFKMQGYTLADTHDLKSEGVDIGLGTPLSVMIQTTFSKIKKAPDPDTSDTQYRLPAQLSIFYAGRVTDKIGAFVQITAEDGTAFSQDNTDIRFADIGQLGSNDVTYGVTLNNNPTVQDPWKSTPGWGFPWFEAGYGYENPGSMIESVGGAVAGLAGYAFWNNHIYTELGAYNASNTGADKANEVTSNAAPYWRLAYTADMGSMNWEVSTLGMSATLPGEEKLTDTALDTQIQWMLDGNQSLTLDANYIHESQPNSEHLNTMKADLTWYTNQTWGITVGYRGASSSDNAIHGADASATGKLDATSYQLQLDYTMAQYPVRIAVHRLQQTERGDGRRIRQQSDDDRLLVPVLRLEWTDSCCKERHESVLTYPSRRSSRTGREKAIGFGFQALAACTRHQVV